MIDEAMEAPGAPTWYLDLPQLLLLPSSHLEHDGLELEIRDIFILDQDGDVASCVLTRSMGIEEH